MTRLGTFLTLLALLGLGAFAAPAAAETYDAEGGINWFGDDDSESVGAFDDGEGISTDYDYDSDLISEDAAGESTFTSDDFGAYDSDFDWDTNDEWFEDWYGESDDLF